MNQAVTSIRNLEPTALWQIFDLFTQHPRPSRHEEAVLCAIESLCDEHQLSHKRDEIGNLIIRKPATNGMEDRQTVVMQGHIDMVPQKNADSTHNFETDPILTQIMDGWVTATGTTLGADNGIGVAAALAVLISNDIPHGPLEVLITIDEESGMTGAEHLKPGWLEADILLNLDTEDEGELYVGCAGGVDISAKLPMEWEPVSENGVAFELALRGLRGGHSGLDINSGRGNANKLINRFLQENLESLDFRIFEFNGGTLRNAIPRESFTKVVIRKDCESDLKNAINAFNQQVQSEYAGIETHFSLNAEPVEPPQNVYTPEATLHVIKAVENCIHGVVAMSDDFENTVETSNNLAIVKSEQKHVSILCLARSLSDFERDNIAHSIEMSFQSAGASTTLSGRYPGWKPDPKSKILNIMTEVHEDLFGYAPKTKVIHAGLECGLLSKPYPHWDIISFGPNIRHAHSPDEKVEIKSVKWFWQFLCAVLKSIPEKIVR